MPEEEKIQSTEQPIPEEQVILEAEPTFEEPAEPEIALSDELIKAVEKANEETAKEEEKEEPEEKKEDDIEYQELLHKVKQNPQYFIDQYVELQEQTSGEIRKLKKSVKDLTFERDEYQKEIEDMKTQTIKKSKDNLPVHKDKILFWQDQNRYITDPTPKNLAKYASTLKNELELLQAGEDVPHSIEKTTDHSLPKPKEEDNNIQDLLRMRKVKPIY